MVPGRLGGHGVFVHLLLPCYCEVHDNIHWITWSFDGNMNGTSTPHDLLFLSATFKR
jgi:hypothetical protein